MVAATFPITMRLARFLSILGLVCAAAAPARAGEPVSAPEAAVQAPAPGAAAAPAPSIVLYTMGQGDVLWEKFGHAAICAEYAPAARRRSLCYNYGTTDFSAPVSVGWGFLRGQGEFWVSESTPQTMIRRYMEFARNISLPDIPLPGEA